MYKRQFVKVALGTEDGHVVESVRIPLERPGRFSACVSSQAGCALACAFCATGRLGLARNLEAWEIVEQVRLLRQTLGPGQRVHGVVFQGMGEPLANVDRVIEAIRVMCDPSALAIDARAITVCTSGLPGGIRRIGRDLPKVRLGVSITSARSEVRRRLMPIDDVYPLDEVIDAVEEHARATGLSPMWAVTPLALSLIHIFAQSDGPLQAQPSELQLAGGPASIDPAVGVHASVLVSQERPASQPTIGQV